MTDTMTHQEIVDKYEKLMQIPAGTFYRDRGDIGLQTFDRLLAEASQDLLSDNQQLSAMALRTLSSHSSYIAQGNIVLPIHGENNVHQISLSPAQRQGYAEAYLKIADRLSRHAEKSGADASLPVMQLLESSHTIARTRHYNGQYSRIIWPDMRQAGDELIHRTFEQLVDLHPETALNIVNHQQYDMEPLLDCERASGLLLEKSYAIIATEGRDANRRDPALALALQQNGFTKRLNIEERRRHFLSSDNRDNVNFKILNGFANQAITSSNDTVRTKDIEKTDLKRKRKEKNARDDYANKQVMAYFDDLKDTIEPRDQLLFWARIHSQARSGSKIHREATRQMKKVFDTITPEQAVSFSFNGGMRAVITDLHMGLPGGFNADGSRFKLKDTTKLLYAQMALDYLPHHQASLEKAHPDIDDRHDTLVNDLAQASMDADKQVINDKIKENRQFKNSVSQAQSEERENYSTLFETFMTLAKNKHQARNLGNKLINQYADAYAQRPEGHCHLSFDQLAGFLTRGEQHNIKIPIDTVERLNALKPSGYSSQNDVFIKRFEQEAMKSGNTKAAKKTRNKMWALYQDNIKQISEPGARLHEITQSAQRIAERYKNVPKQSTEIIKVVKKHADDIASMPNLAVEGNLSHNGFYGARSKAYALDAIANTAGLVQPKILRDFPALHDNITRDFDENHRDQIQQARINGESYAAEHGVSPNGIPYYERTNQGLQKRRPTAELAMT